MSNTDFNNDESQDFPAAAPAVQPAPATGRWDKLTIINQALVNTANNTVMVADDNSDEWLVASSAYDQWLEILSADRDWKFASVLSPALNRLGDSAFPGYGDVFAMPVNCLQLNDVWRIDLAALIQPALFGAPSDQYNTQPPPLDYKIIGNQIHTTAELGAVAMYVPFPDAGQPWSVLFVAALRLTIEAACFRGLNEDFSEGNRAEKAATMMLDRASAREDMQEPRRVAFRSRLNERRRFGRYGGCGYGG